MTMERRIYAAALGIAVLAFSCFPARMAGQAIDPTVEVTRDYEGKLMEVHKPLFKMPVADSLQHFDLEFDYSVYDSPYKGTYDFNPYLLNTRPAPAPYSGKSLWLKAGAGYALQPVLDFVWTPGLKGRFRMSVYGSHRSYIGRYRGIRDVYDGSRVRLEDPYRTGYGSRSGADGSTAWSGYDMVTAAGVNGSVAWDGGEFSFDAGYYGIAAGDTVLTRGYDALVAPLKGSKLPKSRKVFDNSKVTDHHAIIPTGAASSNMTAEESMVYDLVARRFVAAFYPDCEISTTTVIGKVEDVEFKATGKLIVKQGWRAVFSSSEDAGDRDSGTGNAVLPDFKAGESGPHSPQLKETWTTPPKPYTEATLLRAMETAGKFVGDEELRDALKENGIGRPSTRAAIIETLFRRNYIRKEKKNLYPTQTGKELIGTIHEELLKSAELTGMWEKKLRMIENGTYRAGDFIDELKAMAKKIVVNVLSDNS